MVRFYLIDVTLLLLVGYFVTFDPILIIFLGRIIVWPCSFLPPPPFSFRHWPSSRITITSVFKSSLLLI